MRIAGKTKFCFCIVYLFLYMEVCAVIFQISMAASGSESK